MSEYEGRYIAEFRGAWRWCVSDTSRMICNDAIKPRGEATTYRPAIVAAHVKSEELANRIAGLLSEADYNAVEVLGS